MARITDIAALVGLAAACREVPTPEAEVEHRVVEPTVEVSHPWSVVRSDHTAVVLRRDGGQDGVWVQLARDERGREPGVTPILSGKAHWVEDEGRAWPLVSPLYEIHGVEVVSQGVDAVVRLTGPPLSNLSDHPEAPDDPSLVWVRLRPRGGTWRVVVTGLAVLSWRGEAPPEVETLDDHERGGSEARAWLSTAPSLLSHDPYPEVSLTLSP